MGHYIDLRCHKCGFSFTGGYKRTGVPDNLGLPFLACPKCRTVNRTGEKIWSQMVSAERAKYVFSRVIQALCNALVLTIVIFSVCIMVAEKKEGGDPPKEVEINLIMISSFCGILIGSLLMFFCSRRIIRQLEDEYKNGNWDVTNV